MVGRKRHEMGRKDAWIDAINKRIEMEGKKKHIEILKTEVDVLASRLEPHDTGHLHTAISVLKHRVKELEKEVKEDG